MKIKAIASWIFFGVFAGVSLGQTPQEKLRLEILADPNLKPLAVGLQKKFPKACASLGENKGNRTYKIYQEAGAGFYSYLGPFEVEQGTIRIELVCWYGYHFRLNTVGHRAFEVSGKFKGLPTLQDFTFSANEYTLGRYLHYGLDRPNPTDSAEKIIKNDPLIDEIFAKANEQLGNCAKKEVRWTGESTTKYLTVKEYKSKKFDFRFRCDNEGFVSYEFSGRYFEDRKFAIIDRLQYAIAVP